MKIIVSVVILFVFIVGLILIILYIIKLSKAQRDLLIFILTVIGGFVPVMVFLYAILMNITPESSKKEGVLFDQTPTLTSSVPPTMTPSSSPTPLPTFTLTLSPTLTFTPPPITSPTPIPCICQSSTDYETMSCLIQKESEAANLGSLDLIAKIFAPNAVIFRGDTKETWSDPLLYYRPTFNALKFHDAVHSDLTQVEVIGQTFYWISGSSGKYTTQGGKIESYNNPLPSEHWVFQKDSKSCWVITRFEFNASLITFPP